MKMTVERELRVENAFSGQIISVKTGEVTQENSELDPLACTHIRSDVLMIFIRMDNRKARR